MKEGNNYFYVVAKQQIQNNISKPNAGNTGNFKHVAVVLAVTKAFDVAAPANNKNSNTATKQHCNFKPHSTHILRAYKTM